MSFIRERSNNSNSTTYYTIEHIKSNEDAVRWLSSVRNVDGIKTNYMEYSDLQERTSEGSNGLLLYSKVDVNKMVSEMKKRSVDLILLTGEFYSKPVVIGVNLVDKSVNITLRNSNPADINLLEEKLGLSNN